MGIEEVFHLSGNQSVYENDFAISRALETIPLQQLYEQAEKALASGREGGFEDHLVMALLKWFKPWFKWVNSPECDRCGGETKPQGAEPPTPEEAKYGARAVEIYYCEKCRTPTRFPRYNDPVKLLETRRGRCGEWANAFTLLLKALDLDVRYIWNAEDHVWNEVYSPFHERWVHVDSCEEAYDRPLIYADGWGKKMSYVLGFSTTGARDVTRRYVRRPDASLPRNRFNEGELDQVLRGITMDLRQRMTGEMREIYSERDEVEEAEMMSYEEEQVVEVPRQSGAPEWVAQRGEDGLS